MQTDQLTGSVKHGQTGNAMAIALSHLMFLQIWRRNSARSMLYKVVEPECHGLALTKLHVQVNNAKTTVWFSAASIWAFLTSIDQIIDKSSFSLTTFFPFTPPTFNCWDSLLTFTHGYSLASSPSLFASYLRHPYNNSLSTICAPRASDSAVPGAGQHLGDPSPAFTCDLWQTSGSTSGFAK